MAKTILNISEPSRLLTVAEVAIRLGISRKTIYNAMSLGTFPIKYKRSFGKPVFFNRDLEAYIEGLPYEESPVDALDKACTKDAESD